MCKKYFIYYFSLPGKTLQMSIYFQTPKRVKNYKLEQVWIVKLSLRVP